MISCRAATKLLVGWVVPEEGPIGEETVEDGREGDEEPAWVDGRRSVGPVLDC